MNVRKIPAEVKAAIVAAAPTVSNMDLARKYGVSDATVCTWRKRAGIVLEKRGKPRSGAPQRKLATVAAKVRVPAAVMETASLEETAVVTLRFTLGQLEGIWGKLSLDVKAAAIGAALQLEA